jgi:hypothetical protein
MMKNQYQIESSEYYVNGMIKCWLCPRLIEPNPKICDLLEEEGKVLCCACLYDNLPRKTFIYLNSYLKGALGLDEFF